MSEITKETITTQQNNSQVATTPTGNQASQSQSIEYVIYFIFGALDVLLAFRLVLKFLGASTVSAFVRMVYSSSGIFIWPFEGIFRRAVTQGIETSSVLEPATIVALIVYGILAWGIVKLVQLLSGKQQS